MEEDISWMSKDALCWVDFTEQEEATFKQGLIKEFQKKIYIVSVDNKDMVVKLNQLFERTIEETTYGDMVNMEIINDGQLLNNLKQRFLQDQIFTLVGPTLLVINPFKNIPSSFTQEKKTEYIQFYVGDLNSSRKLEPHIYQISCLAYKQLFENDKSQSIVISGESGAGKTENAKFCMNLLTSIGQYYMANFQKKSIMKVKENDVIDGLQKEVQSSLIKSRQSQDENMETKILSCNPILEAFGNAKTVRNNNSSRFGKYVNMFIDKKSKKIRGAEIINYLLEKSRITSQLQNERNFHIFYHLYQAESTYLEKLYLNTPMTQHSYLNKSQCYEVQGINDKTLFDEVSDSLNVLGLTDHYDNIFKLTASVLLIGNIEFDDKTFGNGIKYISHQLLETPCAIIGPQKQIQELLGLDDLAQILCMKSRTVQNQLIYSPLNKGECSITKDSVAKEIYFRLFNFLVDQLNRNITTDLKEQCGTVGLLDIYGFEVFNLNGFEQLLINYTNEKLHQLYIHYVFKQEEDIFRNEDLGQYLTSMKFVDNQAIIDIMEKKVFSQLDEACSLPGTDLQYLSKLKQSYNNVLINPKPLSAPAFQIIHTAKPVTYHVDGFKDKNKDEIPKLAQNLMANSSNPLMKILFEQSENSKEKFICQKIKKAMSQLMGDLTSADVHFVRCLKPNEQKKKDIFDDLMVINQIRYLGVLDSLRVRRQTYPIRKNYQMFYRQFSDMTSNPPYPILLQQKADFQALSKKLIQEFFSHLHGNQVLTGITKVFMKQQGYQEMGNIFSDKISIKNKMAFKIQRSFKTYKFNKGLKKYFKIMNYIKQVITRTKMRIRLRKLVRQILIVKNFIRKLILERQKKKYVQIISTLSEYIQRFYCIHNMNKVDISARKIQRNYRIYKQNTLKRLKNFFIKIVIDETWLKIQNKKAVIIQKYIRGFLTRRQNKSILNELIDLKKERMKQQLALIIQKRFKGYRIRKQFLIKKSKAQVIQGYFKTKWTQYAYQRVRQKAIIIQRFLKPKLQEQIQQNYIFEEVLQPQATNVEESNQQQNSIINQLSSYQQDPLQKKGEIVMIPIEVNIFLDITDIYEEGWVEKLIEKQQHKLQYLKINDNSTMAFYQNRSLYCWGEQNYEIKNTQIKQIEAFNDQMFMLSDKGNLMIDTVQNIQYEHIKQIAVYSKVKSIHNLQKMVRTQSCSPRKVKYPTMIFQFKLVKLRVVQTFYVYQQLMESYLLVGITILDNQDKETSKYDQFKLNIGQPRQQPTQVKINNVIKQISCGFQHVACRSTTLFLWGQNQSYPIQQKLAKITWVSSANIATYVMTEHLNVYKLQNISSKPQEIQLPHKYPVRIVCTQSKQMEVISISFFFDNGVFGHNKNLLIKKISKLTQDWSENQPDSIFPLSDYNWLSKFGVPKSQREEGGKNNFEVDILLNALKIYGTKSHANLISDLMEMKQRELSEKDLEKLKNLKKKLVLT